MLLFMFWHCIYSSYAFAGEEEEEEEEDFEAMYIDLAEACAMDSGGEDDEMAVLNGVEGHNARDSTLNSDDEDCIPPQRDAAGASGMFFSSDLQVMEDFEGLGVIDWIAAMRQVMLDLPPFPT